MRLNVKAAFTSRNACGRQGHTGNKTVRNTAREPALQEQRGHGRPQGSGQTGSRSSGTR